MPEGGLEPPRPKRTLGPENSACLFFLVYWFLLFFANLIIPCVYVFVSLFWFLLFWYSFLWVTVQLLYKHSIIRKRETRWHVLLKGVGIIGTLSIDTKAKLRENHAAPQKKVSPMNGCWKP